jgi:hypothetical protein
MGDSNEIKETKRLVGALLRMPPKPHSEMKLGKSGKSNPNKTKVKSRKSKPR